MQRWNCHKAEQKIKLGSFREDLGQIWHCQSLLDDNWTTGVLVVHERSCRWEGSWCDTWLVEDEKLIIRDQGVARFSFRRPQMRMKTRLESWWVETDLRWCEVWRRGGQVAQQELCKWGDVFCWSLATRETCRIVGSSEGMLASTAPLDSPLFSTLWSSTKDERFLGGRQSSRYDRRQSGTLTTQVWCSSQRGFDLVLEPLYRARADLWPLGAWLFWSMVSWRSDQMPSGHPVAWREPVFPL